MFVDGEAPIDTASYTHGVRSEPWDVEPRLLADIIVAMRPPLLLFPRLVGELRTTNVEPALFIPREIQREVGDDLVKIRYRTRLRDQGMHFVEALVAANPHHWIDARVVDPETDKVLYRGIFQGGETLHEWPL